MWPRVFGSGGGLDSTPSGDSLYLSFNNSESETTFNIIASQPSVTWV